MAAKHADFKNSVSLFLADRKNANKLIELLEYLQTEKFGTEDCLSAIAEIFKETQIRGDFIIDSDLKITNPKEYEMEEQYVKWLRGVYDKFFIKLLQFVVNSPGELSSLALGTLFQLIKFEASRNGSETPNFPLESFERIVFHLICVDDNSSILSSTDSYFNYLDVLFYGWKTLRALLSTDKLDETDETTSNIIYLIEKMKIPKDLESMSLLCFTDVSQFKVFKETVLRKNVQKVFCALANRPLSRKNHRSLLTVLIEDHLSNLPRPTLLTDFMVGSLSLGDVVGILALQGMSILVTKHNLECPDIFGKLYNLFQPEVFYTRYKPRLFYLADLFFSSTHVPEQMTAAFAKRLSRLSLLAQSSDLVLIMQFVGNLLIRHPALSFLIHSTDRSSMDDDPFIMDEKDPMKSRAMESSLWELSLLKNHVQPKVSAAAKFLDGNLPSIEWDIREELETTYSSIFESEMKKNAKMDPALTFVRPVSIAQLSDDRVYKLWSLT